MDPKYCFVKDTILAVHHLYHTYVLTLWLWNNGVFLGEITAT